MSFTPSENPITHPTRESYTELRPFRFWCQKVLPLVYDDSLSYYELLCKVVDYLNKTMEDVDHMNTDIDTLYSNFQEFQEGTFTIYNELVDYVNTYFDELDVQEEINNKLDDMVLSGELVNVLQPTIADEVSAWLAEHLTPTQPTIDDTLSISGAGADAKVTGDLIRNVTRDYYNSAMFKKSIVSKNTFGLHSIGENSSEHWFYVNNNNQTFGMSEIKYADNPIVVFKHQSAVDNGIECAVQMFTKTGEHFFGNISLGSWFGETVNSGLLSTSIPSGVYYWIGFRNGTNPCTLKVDDIANNFEIFEPVNKVGVASSSTTKPFSYSQNISIVDIDIKHAETDLLITSDDWSKCIYTIQYYTDNIPTAIASTEYSLQKDSVIPKGSYYRIVRWAKDDNGNNIVFNSYEDAINTIDSRIIIRNNSEEFLLKKSFDRSKMIKKDLLSGFSFGNTVTSGNETNGYRLVNSPTTFGLSNFVYSDNPIVIFMNSNAVSANISLYAQCYKFENNKFVKQRALIWGSGSPMTLSSICIPKGWYYWIGFRDGNNPTHLSKEDLFDKFEIYETPYNIGFGSSRTTQLGISYTQNSMFCNIDANYAETDLLVSCGEHWCKDIAITWETLADLENGGTNVSYTNITDFVIPKGTYYRCFGLMRVNGINIDPTTVTPDTILEYANMVKIIPNNSYHKEWYDNNKIDTNGLFNQISLLANRVYELEKINNVDNIPSYYNTDDYLENKITAINNAKPTNGTQFIFISDVHINGYLSQGGNALHSHALINKICKDTSVNCVFNGGDFLSNQHGYSVPESIEKIKKCMSYTTPDNNKPHFVIVGNHDGGIDYDGNGNVIAPRHLTNVQLAQACNIYGQAYNVVYDINSPFEYYYDDYINKIRYIVLDYGLRDLATDEAYFDTLKFYLDALMSVQNNWTIIVFNHLNGYDHVNNTFNADYLNYIYNPANAYKNRSVYNDFTAYTRDFSNCKGNIACLIFGHKHGDFQGTTTSGIPWFIVTTDNAGASIDATVRTIGTINEQAFDVFSINTTAKTITVTRIGGGLDRTASY